MAYTLEDGNQLRALLRAAPEKDPNQRRMDKQAIIKLIVEDIAAIQERGYALEEVAELLAKGGFELTLPTLKSYLQRARKTSAKGAGKAPRRSSVPTVKEQARAAKPITAKAVPVASREGDTDPASSAPKSTQSEFIATDRKRL